MFSRLVLFLALLSPLAAQDFQPVPVTRLDPAAHQLYHLGLSLEGTDLGAAYTRAGQFLQLRIGERRPRFFAIASAPGAGSTLELLLKIDAGNDPILGLKPGETVEITPPGGPGFPVEAHAGKRWILMAMGSGISAIRPLIAQTAARDSEVRITLLYGVRNLSSLPYRDLLPVWHDQGVDIRLVLSRPDADDAWTGRTGYVQDHLSREMLEPGEAAIFVVGSNEMVGAIREKLVEIGHPEVPIATNF